MEVMSNVFIIIILLFGSLCGAQSFNITRCPRPTHDLFAVNKKEFVVNHAGLYELDIYPYKLYGGSTKLYDLIGVPDTKDDDWFNLYDPKSFNMICGISWFFSRTFSINSQICMIYYKKEMYLFCKFGISYYF